MIAAAESRAAEMERPIAIAVVDESGVPKALSRMDGAPLVAVKIAQNKAYTAAGFGLSMDASGSSSSRTTHRSRWPAGRIERLLGFGGGYPL